MRKMEMEALHYTLLIRQVHTCHMCKQIHTVAEVTKHGVEEVDVATEVNVATEVDVAVVVMVQHPSSQARVGIATRWAIAKLSVERSSKKEEEW